MNMPSSFGNIDAIPTHPARSILQIRGLNVCHGKTKILEDINLDLHPGQPLAILGESGAGKTTLGLTIMGLGSGTAQGQITFNGDDLLAMDRESIRNLRGREIAMVFQNVENALNPVHTVQEQTMEAVYTHDRCQTKSSLLERVHHLFGKVGLDEKAWSSYPHQLNGGAKQRVLIALALINDPQVLILDEPTASLDTLSKASVVFYLKEALQDKAALLITHDFSIAAQISSWIGILYNGRIVEYGPTHRILDSPRHPYTRGLLRSFPDIHRGKDLQGITGRREISDGGECSFQNRCTQSTTICSNNGPP